MTCIIIVILALLLCVPYFLDPAHSKVFFFLSLCLLVQKIDLLLSKEGLLCSSFLLMNIPTSPTLLGVAFR